MPAPVLLPGPALSEPEEAGKPRIEEALQLLCALEGLPADTSGPLGKVDPVLVDAVFFHCLEEVVEAVETSDIFRRRVSRSICYAGQEEASFQERPCAVRASVHPSP